MTQDRITLHGVPIEFDGGWPGIMPDGVHVLSAESQAALARAAAKGEVVTARHTKRVS